MDPEPKPVEWRMVGLAVETRISELGLSINELARRSGVSNTTIRKVISGRPLTRADKVAALERGLGWRRHSIERLAKHGEIPEGNDSRLARLEAVRDRVRELEEQSQAGRYESSAEEPVGEWLGTVIAGLLALEPARRQRLLDLLDELIDEQFRLSANPATPT